jgi:hypothetical protein
MSSDWGSQESPKACSGWRSQELIVPNPKLKLLDQVRKVITGINRKTLSSVDETEAALQKGSGKPALLRVWNNGSTRFVVVGLKAG